jgi:hypothetical protein
MIDLIIFIIIDIIMVVNIVMDIITIVEKDSEADIIMTVMGIDTIKVIVIRRRQEIMGITEVMMNTKTDINIIKNTTKHINMIIETIKKTEKDQNKEIKNIIKIIDNSIAYDYV